MVLQNAKVIVFHGTSSAILNTINGISLAPREVDILACILIGREVKSIAAFLSFSHKTVEAHIRALMRKLGSDSWEALIDCIEKSGKSPLLKKHYQALCTQSIFEQYLKISILIRPKGVACRLVDMREQKDKLSLLHQLEKHLERGGIKILPNDRDGEKSALASFRHRGSQERNYTLYITLQGQVAQLQAKNSTILQGAGSSTVLLVDRSMAATISNDTGYINLGNQENYYFSVFEILKRMFPDIIFDKIITAFKKQDG